MIDTTARAAWMSVLALATTAELEAAWAGLPVCPEHQWLRAPEIGLAMVRARAGGTGARFNLGEMTVTRCSVVLADGTVGHAHVGARRRRHAELAALLDALLQSPAHRAEVEARVVEPLAAAQRRRRHAVAARSAPTRVEFFTMVRGE